MASCSGIVSDVDYGCGAPGSISVFYNTQEPSFDVYSSPIPGQALLRLYTEIGISASNITIDDSTGGTLMAWLLFSTKAAPLLESYKYIYFSSGYCIGGEGSTLPLSVVPIQEGDTAIRLKPKWGTLYGSQAGLDVPGCDWEEIPLGDNLTITPPQNLQVNFPDNIYGSAYCTLSSWSKNPNISGAVFTPFEDTPSDATWNNWNWKSEIIDWQGNIVLEQEYITRAFLEEYLYLNDANTLPANAGYRWKITTSNYCQATTSATSGVIYIPPRDLSLQSPVFTENEDGTYGMSVFWEKAAESKEFEEIATLSVKVGDEVVTNNQELYRGYGGAASGTYSLNSVPSGTKISIMTTITSSAGVGGGYWQDYFTPAHAPEISYNWNDAHTELTISATSTNITQFEFRIGTTPGDSNLAWEKGVPSVTITGLDYETTKYVYAQVHPYMRRDEWMDWNYYDTIYSVATIPLLHPVLGIVKTCDETTNIVDIVETKGDGSISPRWLGGQRVKIIEACPVDPVGGGSRAI